MYVRAIGSSQLHNTKVADICERLQVNVRNGAVWQVSVPCNSLFTVVTVRCGHCANLLSVNMGASLQAVPPQPPQVYNILLASFFWDIPIRVSSTEFLTKI